MRPRASTVPVVAVAVFAFAFVGCATPVPTTQNASKFVHVDQQDDSPQGEQADQEDDDAGGKVTASIGLTGASESPDQADDSDLSLVAFPTEAAYTGYLGDSYDLAISGGNGLVNLTGDLIFVDDGMRLGFLHGVGLGYSGQENDVGFTDDQDFFQHRIQGNATGGLFYQSSDGADGTLFAAARYTYGGNAVSNAGDNAPDIDNEWRDAHFLTANLGITMPAGGAFVAPEIAGTWGMYNEPDTDRFFVTVGLSMSSAH